MKIGDKVVARVKDGWQRGQITGMHGDAEYYTVSLDNGRVVYRFEEDIMEATMYDKVMVAINGKDEPEAERIAVKLFNRTLANDSRHWHENLVSTVTALVDYAEKEFYIEGFIDRDVWYNRIKRLSKLPKPETPWYEYCGRVI